MGSGRGQYSGGSPHGIRLLFPLPGRTFFHAHEPLCPSHLFWMLVFLCTSLVTSSPLGPGQLTSGSMPCYCLSCLLCVPFWTLRSFSSLFPCFSAKRKICLEVSNTTRGMILPGSFLLISFSVLSLESSSILEPCSVAETPSCLSVLFDFYGYLTTHDQGGYILLNTWTF